MKVVNIIGSGFAGLSAACYCAKAGYKVNVYERNEVIGGRARQLKTDNGYIFDMGPSWYWMPDVFDKFFSDFGYRTSDLYALTRLDPQFEIRFNDEVVAIDDNFDKLKATIESIEPRSSKQFANFMQDARSKYDLAMGEFVEKPCHSWTEFFSLKMLRSALQLDLLTSFTTHVRKYFRSAKLRQLMEFPILFLGADPSKIPAMYSLMNYSGLEQGTWYPHGGFGSVIASMEEIARKLGVMFHTGSAVGKIEIVNGKATGLIVDGEFIPSDSVIATADYHHVETKLLDDAYRNYSEDYWKSRTFAPSALIFYVGIKRKIPNLSHHTLFFENDFAVHSREIYESKTWPTAPLFYVCCPSKSDSTVAPEGHENLFFLMPLATGVDDDEAIREKYFNEMLSRLELHTNTTDLRSEIDYKKSYCVSDFRNDYNAFGGNAYGLANTLRQTAVLKPAVRNRKVANLFYAGQLTVPGPGVPPSLISGKIASSEVVKYLKKLQ